MLESQLKVLLIEDNPGDVRLVEEALSEVTSPKFHVTQVSKLGEGLRLLGKKRFDVVLLDLLLDDSPRLGTLMEVYEQSSNVPVVVLTGLDDDTVSRWVIREGAQDYLIKSQIDGELLRHTLVDAVDRHSALVRKGPLPQQQTEVRIPAQPGSFE